MRTLLALWRWELRLQLRSTRCRAAVALYLVLCAVPPAIFFVMSRATSFGPATYLHHLLEVQPFLTLLLAVLVAGHRADAAAWRETWPVLASAPVSSAGYLLGRFTAMVAIVLPVSAVPFAVAAALATAGGSQWQEITSWVGSWALRIAPLVPVSCALWLGSVTILGGELAALGMVYVGFELVLWLINRILLELGLVVEYSLTLGSFRNLSQWIGQLDEYVGRYRESYAPQLVESDARFDARGVAEWVLPQLLIGAALSGFVLALAVLFVRRSRRDLKPRPVRGDHPIRSYLELLLGLRERLAPAGALGRREWMVMGAGVVLLAAGLGLNVHRQKEFLTEATRRYEAMVGDPVAPTPAEIRPRQWKLVGSVETSGTVSFEATTTLVNVGDEPHGQLGFALNEHLEILAAEAGGRRVTYEKTWDRVRLDVDPPLGPGETLELVWRLEGTPGTIHFPFRGFRFDTYVTLYDRYRQATLSRHLTDLSTSRRFLAVTPRRLELPLDSLGPVPRYTPWTMVMVDHGGGEQPQVPDESTLAEVMVEIDLEAPPGFFLADACGNAGRPGAGRTRLVGGCRLQLGDYLVYGAPLEVVEESGVVFAALWSHLDSARSFGASLAEAARLSDKAWPDMEGFSGLVVAEWVPHFKGRRRPWSWGIFELRGRLLLLREDALSIDYLPNGERLVADLMTRDLIARRPVAAEHELFFSNFYASLMMLRMGVGHQRSALVSADPVFEIALKKPLLTAGQYDGNQWRRRLPALLFDLRQRLGSQRLFEGIEAFLATGGEASSAVPGTVEELFEHLEQAAGMDLGRFYDDFIVGTAVPKLRLYVDSSRRDENGRYRVAGRVENHGTGHVICPVFVKTELGVITTTVGVGSETSVPWAVTAPSRPFQAELDPDGTCHRLVAKTRMAAERVDISV